MSRPGSPTARPEARHSAAAARRLRRAVLLGCLLCAASAFAADRFPRPEFESGYRMPRTATPAPRAPALTYLDVIVLAGVLGATSAMALKTRSRRGIVALSLFSLAWFGFWRKGCVCPVGSVQNVAQAVADPAYRLPLTVMLFFLLPLVCALFFGRTFCAAACPLGAVQDVFVLRPIRVPRPLAAALGLLPALYLGVALALAAAGAGFLICRYDPFVGFFRFGGPLSSMLTGGALLLVGTVVARPYCRFLCPYGVLLNGLSRFSRRHADITPTECVNCRLCEDACPFGCIRPPTPEKAPEPRAAGRRRLAVLLALLPLLAAAGGLAVSSLAVPLSQLHPLVRQAEFVLGEDRGRIRRMTLEGEAFRASGQAEAELVRGALAVRDRIRANGWIAGGLLGALFGGRLVALCVRRRREYYEIDRGTCFSCGRCFRYCPQEHIRLRGKPGAGRPDGPE